MTTRPYNLLSSPDAPLRWRKPCVARIEPDLFSPGITDDQRDRVLAVVALCPRVTFLAATEQVDEMAKHLGDPDRAKLIAKKNWDICDGYGPWPLPNLILGAIVRDQAEAGARLPWLLKCPAKVRWVDARGMRGKMDLGRLVHNKPGYSGTEFQVEQMGRKNIGWVTCSGGSDPVHPDNIRALRDQCQAAGVPFAFEGWGEWQECEKRGGKYAIAMIGERQRPTKILYADGRSFDYNSNWDGSDDGIAMERVGRKAAGRMLDGRQWDEFPEVEAHA